MPGIKQIVTAILLVGSSFAQQICLKNKCSSQAAACDSHCQKLLSDCTFQCTLVSHGCMQDCAITNESAQALLQCSYERCLDYWRLIWFALGLFLISITYKSSLSNRIFLNSMLQLNSHIIALNQILQSLTDLQSSFFQLGTSNLTALITKIDA